MTSASPSSSKSLRRLIGLMALISALGVGGLAASIRKPDVPLPDGTPFPELTLADWRSGTALPVATAHGTPTVLVLVHSECAACTEQLTTLARHRPRIDARFVFVTPEASPPPAYPARWGWLGTDTTTIWTRALLADIKRELRATATPTIYIYDPAGRLRRSFRGLTSMGAIQREVASAAG